MQEDFLHFIWKHKKFHQEQLETTQYEPVEIWNVGTHNHNSGPDFFNAQIKIGDQLWAGNVEIHMNSSDWFQHNHENDPAYNNVILHVVYQHDTEVFRSDNSTLPTVELKPYLDEKTVAGYRELFSKQNKWINCETHFSEVHGFTINNWLERLFVERLERKSQTVFQLLEKTKNNWEAVLFVLLAKNFGLKVNGEAFQSLAESLDFNVIRKVQSNQMAIEALLFGQASLLDGEYEDSYFKSLSKEYQFLKQKFQLSNQGVLPIQFFRLRPQNFPTLRLSQLAVLYHEEEHLFSQLMDINKKEAFYKLFHKSTAPYWDSHYSFGKESKTSKKRMSKTFVDLLLINTIIPLKFAYYRSLGKDPSEDLFQLAHEIKPEKNHIVQAFDHLKKVGYSSLQTQGLLQLKTEYCDKNQCLQCAIGNALIVK